MRVSRAQETMSVLRGEITTSSRLQVVCSFALAVATKGAGRLIYMKVNVTSAPLGPGARTTLFFQRNRNRTTAPRIYATGQRWAVEALYLGECPWDHCCRFLWFLLFIPFHPHAEIG